MRTPENFNAYDPTHVTLHLVQSLHAAGLQANEAMERNTARFEEQIKKLEKQCSENYERESELRRQIREVEKDRKYAVGQVAELVKGLRRCAEKGNSAAAEYAARCVERWQ